VAVNANATEFDSFTIPFASLKGDVTGAVDSLQLKNQLLTKIAGKLSWKQAELTLPVNMVLGEVELDINPEPENQHIANIKARGGHIEADGKAIITLQGDFDIDVLLTPTNSAPQESVNILSQFARRDAQGRYRWVQSGNVNRL